MTYDGKSSSGLHATKAHKRKLKLRYWERQAAHRARAHRAMLTFWKRD